MSPIRPVADFDPREYADHPLYFYAGAGLSRSAGIFGWRDLVDRIYGYRTFYEGQAADLPPADTAEVNSRLLREFVAESGVDTHPILSRSSTDQRRFGRTVLLNLLFRHAANGWPPSEDGLSLQQAVWRCRPHGVLTTNYDVLIERVCPKEVRALLRVYRHNAAFLPFILTNPVFVLKLHGDINDIGTMVFDPEYAWQHQDGEFGGQTGEWLQQLYSAIIRRGHVLYLGAGFRDRTIRTLHAARAAATSNAALKRCTFMPEEELMQGSALRFEAEEGSFRDITFFTYPDEASPKAVLLRVLDKLAELRRDAPQYAICRQASNIRANIFAKAPFADVERWQTPEWQTDSVQTE